MKTLLSIVFVLSLLTLQAQIKTDKDQLAIKLVNLIHFEKLIEPNAMSVIDIGLKSHPELKKYRGVMKNFLHKILNYDSLKLKFVQFYKKEFTIGELKKLIDFYKSDIGQKTINLMPATIKEWSVFGQQLVAKNKDELM